MPCQKALTPDEIGMLVQFMVEEHGVSQRQACKTLSVPRNTFHYQPKPKNDMPVIQALEELVEKHPAIGFWTNSAEKRRSNWSLSNPESHAKWLCRTLQRISSKRTAKRECFQYPG